MNQFQMDFIGEELLKNNLRVWRNSSVRPFQGLGRGAAPLTRFGDLSPNSSTY